MDLSNTIIKTMENISIETSNADEPGEKIDKVKKDKDCVELKNLEYKNVLMYGNNLKPKDESVNVSVLEELLEKESQMNRLDLWPKLDKTDKIIKLKAYAKILVERHVLNREEEKQLNNYFLYCLERKYLQLYFRPMGLYYFFLPHKY